jgi:hypothetical protein
MKFKKRLQFLALSISLVSVLLLLFLFFVADDSKSEESGLGSGELSSLEITDEVIRFFIDGNINNIKDTSEEFCSLCVAKQIHLEIKTEVGNELVIKEIQENESLEATGLNITALWGYSSDVKFIIPYYSFTDKMSGTDIYIPVVKTSYELIGENTNVRRIDPLDISDHYYETQFEFSSLVPALNSFVNSETPVWFVFYPNQERADKYYLAPGNIVSQGEGKHIANTYWYFNEKYLTQSNINNYRLVIPAVSN